MATITQECKGHVHLLAHDKNIYCDDNIMLHIGHKYSLLNKDNIRSGSDPLWMIVP